MNWYTQNIKYATFINQIQISQTGSDWINIWINGKRYEYSKVPKQLIKSIKEEIHSFKQMKNQRQAGSNLSKLIRKIDKYLHKKNDDNKKN